MKGGIAMMMAAIMRARATGLAPPGDVILSLVSDEESGGVDGARYLVENHAHLFEGVRFAIGEFGGFSTHIGGRKMYPIMIAEKQACWMVAKVRGQGGHGAMPVRGQAMAKLARLLETLDRHRLPVHVTPPARQMIEGIASALPPVQRFIMSQLLKPTLTNRVLDLLGPLGRPLDPLLHNTVSPTMLRASDKCNVIPSEVTLELDGRLLPGYTPEDLAAELNQLLGDEVEFSVFFHEPGPSETDMGLFDTLSDILRGMDPEGTPVPLLLFAVTDARLFARLGIQTYGFTPMKLPPDFAFWDAIHAADERIPIEALDFGADAIYRLLQRFGAAA